MKKITIILLFLLFFLTDCSKIDYANPVNTSLKLRLEKMVDIIEDNNRYFIYENWATELSPDGIIEGSVLIFVVQYWCEDNGNIMRIIFTQSEIIALKNMNYKEYEFIIDEFLGTENLNQTI